MFDDPRRGDDLRDRRGDDHWRDRDDEDTLTLGRSPASTVPRDDHSEDHPRNSDGHSRGLERNGDSRERDQEVDPRDVFMRHLDLPRGQARELVRDRDRDYSLRGSETRR